MEERKDLFQEIPVEERAQQLKDNCYKCEEMPIKRPYTKEELDKFKDELSEKMIALNELETQLDDIKDEFKGKMMPIKTEVRGNLKALKQRFEESEEIVYMFDDQELGEMLYYDAEGKYLQSRKLFPAERQFKIVPLNAKQG